MKRVEKRIDYKYGDIVRLKPIYDVHWGSRYCDERAFREYLADSDEKTYFVGGGDLFDSIVLKDWRYMKSLDKTQGDDFIDTHVDEVSSILAPYKDKILGLGIGNHERTVLKNANTNLVKRTCQLLNVPYLGFVWAITLRLRAKDGRGRTVIIHGHHGWGGGSRTRGADITKFERYMDKFVDVDIFLFGHVHKIMYDKTPRISPQVNKLKAIPRVMAICGTFLKTFSDNEDTTYSEDEGYPPTEVGGITIKLKPTDTGMKINAEV